MALIKCKECGKEISETAENCPHCGYRTAHGRSVSEAKGYLIQWGIAIAVILVGLAMFVSNLGEFMDLSDYFDYYEYFSSEDKSVVWKFVIGTILLIFGICDMFGILYQINQMRLAGNNAYLRNGSLSFSAKNVAGWECSRCYSMNTSGSSSCTRCGASRGGIRPNVQETIPTWKRIQMEESENVE